MAAFVSYSSLFCFLLAATLSSLYFAEATKGGFSVELIHRDSPKSPFYIASETHSDRLIKAFRRSFSRANYRFNPSSISTQGPQPEIIPGDGEYLIKISIGTPPFNVLAIADTGSDLIWMQCLPCEQCYKQDAPLFNPKNSSTYKVLPCLSTQCQATDEDHCSEKQDSANCQYQEAYGDGSYSSGDVAIDTVTLESTNGRPVAFPKTIIGCGHHNGGNYEEKSSGIIGLGGGNVSLVSQMGSSINGEFSYCLVPLFPNSNVSSKINFGSDAEVSGSGVVSTPLIQKDPTFYYLTLGGISVGDEKIELNSSGSDTGAEKGNIIIDSGTTFTMLPPDFYSKVESAVAKQIDATPVESPVLSLCYEGGADLKVPDITVHFTGADVKLQPLNSFIVVSEQVCFSFAANGNVSIYGNTAQMDFLVGYDAQKQTVSFKPTDCSKQ